MSACALSAGIAHFAVPHQLDRFLMFRLKVLLPDICLRLIYFYLVFVMLDKRVYLFPGKRKKKQLVDKSKKKHLFFFFYSIKTDGKFL